MISDTSRWRHHAVRHRVGTGCEVTRRHGRNGERGICRAIRERIMRVSRRRHSMEDGSMKPLTIATRRILATLVAGGALAATSTAFAQGYGAPPPRVEERAPAPGAGV